jgi:hypothetical protein
MSEAPRISLKELRGYVSDAGELAKGTQIADGSALLNLARYENRLYGEAKGSGQAPYRISLVFGDKSGGLKARCSCMAARSRPFCKHSAALLVSWARSPEAFVVGEAPLGGAAEPAARKRSVKTGKAEGTELMKQGVERVGTLVRELAVSGVAAIGRDRVEQVRALGESLRENRLRRLSARTLDLAALLEAGVSRRGQVDAAAYADLLSDMLLTARKLEKHLAGETLEDRYVEELIGKTWRKTDRRPVDGLDLVEYAFHTRTTADDYVIRESRFVDLATGAHYSEKQILPAFLAKRTEPKPSYADRLLRGAAGGLYPGFAPYRLDLETVPAPAPLEPAHVEAVLAKAHPGVSAALAALQEHRRDVFAPDGVPMTVAADVFVADGGRFRLADAAGEALHLPADPWLDEALTLALRQGRLRAVLGDMTIEGILPTFLPMAVVVETPHGLALETVGSAAGVAEPRGRSRTGGDGAHAAWLDDARNAGAPSAAVALGEVRLEMAEALVTGLAGLVARVADPLVSRLRDLGLEKPAALLAELPGLPDAADRLDGFVKVHQVAGLALVRLAGATRVAVADLERLPTMEGIAIRRPPAPLAADELLGGRMAGRLSRHEAAWHRAKHFEALDVEALLDRWPETWADGEAASLVARRLAPLGERAVDVAREVVSSEASGRTARLTAIEVLKTVGSQAAISALRQVASDNRAAPVLRVRARRAYADAPASGWGSILSFVRGGGTGPSVERELDQLKTSRDKDDRVAALAGIRDAGVPEAIPFVRQAWRWDPAQEVRAAAAALLGDLGDSESVEALITVLRDRGAPAKESKAALAALGALGDVRGVPDILQALVESWGGPLPAEALSAVGLPALDPVVALVLSRPELAQRTSLRDAVRRLTASPATGSILKRRMTDALEAPDSAEKAATLLKLAAESDPLRESLARQVLSRVKAPSTKAEKALVRAAQQALQKREKKAAPTS